MATIKAKFGTIALGDRVGMLGMRAQSPAAISRDSSRSVQVDPRFHRAANTSKLSDRANIHGTISFPVIKIDASYDRLDCLKYCETLLNAVKSLREGDLTFTKDNWATVFLTYPGAVFSRMSAPNDAMGQVQIDLTFEITEAEWT